MSDLNIRSTDGEGTKDTMHTPEHFTGIQHSHLGPILGVLVIMLVLILSGLYLWGEMLSKQAQTTDETPIVNNEPETPRATADAQILDTLSPSDELDAIDADLNSTQLDSLDTELNTIDTELNAALPQ